MQPNLTKILNTEIFISNNESSFIIKQIFSAKFEILLTKKLSD